MQGWLTPNEDQTAAAIVRRRFSLPGELLYLLMGALDQLTYSFSWETFGDLTPQEAADLFSEIVNGYEDMTRPVGSVCFTMGAIPDYGLQLDGAIYHQSAYPELYASIDSDFHLPNIGTGNRFKLPDTVNSPVFFLAHWNAGLVGGASQVTLTEANLPAHAHTESVAHPNALAVAPGELPIVASGTPGATGTTGGGSAFSIMPPYLGLIAYVIARP